MILSLFIATATFASGGAQDAGTDGNDRSQRMICRTREDTGSRVRASRICRTAAEWEEERRAARDFAAGRQGQYIAVPEIRSAAGSTSEVPTPQ